MTIDVVLLLCVMLQTKMSFAEVSVAVGKPAFVDNGGPARAGKANDGDRSTISSNCVESASTNDTYWGVDLQGVYKLRSINILARNPTGCGTPPCSDRLSNFAVRIGYVRKDPEVNALCAIRSEVIPVGSEGTVVCEEPLPCGRYLSLQRVGPPWDQPLNLCEVDVFADVVTADNSRSRTAQMTSRKDQRLVGKAVFPLYDVTSDIECLRGCIDHMEECSSVNILTNSTGKYCEINFRAFGEKNIALTDVTGWSYYGVVETSCG